MTIQELEQFIHTYGKSIYSFCRTLCQNREQADELYQDVCLKAMQELPTIQSTNNVKSYLLSFAVSIWRNKKRKAAWRNRIAPQKALTEEADAAAADTADALSQMLAAEEAALVRAAVARLRDIYRIPILLYYMEELPIKEIARLLHLPAGTVKRRLHNAKQQLKKDLEDSMYE